MDSIVTADLSKFGYKELDEAGKLLMAYAEHGSDFLGDGLTLNMNANSGYVFLADEDLNTGMLTDDGKVSQWFNCPVCGNEGFDGDYPFEDNNGYCSENCQKENDGE